jgi:hypothetical protein
MNVLKSKITIIVAVLMIGVGIGYFTKPTKVETRTVEVEKTKVVQKEGKSKYFYKKKIIKPDGTIEEIEVTKEEWDKLEAATSEKQSDTATVIKNDIGLSLSAFVLTPAKSLGKEMEYGVHVSKRVIGSVAVGVMATTDKKIGVSIGVDF